jgi:hypothetical protein
MDEITITLTRDEALVLVNWLGRIDEIASLSKTPEQKALWRLEGCLEAKLTEIFDSNYVKLVDAARQRLATKYGE